VNRAAPTAAAFAGSPDWAQLWLEAESCLFGPGTALPSDWVMRAEAALTARRVPGFSPASVFLPRNLLPFVATLALLAATPVGGADAGAAAYGRSEFAAAEKVWRDALAQRPTDWIAHHNLALALAQQDRWSEAAGHATAAFVQNPSHPSVRWHFDLALNRAGYAPPDLAAFARPRPVHQLARLFSPAQWQWILGGAGLMLGLAGALTLLHLYRRGPRWTPLAAWLCLALAFATGATASASLHRYGLAQDPRTAVVWHATTLRSIPTEADTAQKTSPLPAGSLALVERSFLGWLRLAFPNGQTGWVRNEDVVRLYR